MDAELNPGQTPRNRVLHIARDFPDAVLPRLGLWTERLVRSTMDRCSVEVIAPVPYWPPVPGPANFRRFRRVPRETILNGIRVHHPRFMVGPGSALQRFEGLTMYAGIRRLAARLHAEQQFDVIHGHFVFPAGWAAARLANEFRVPLIITEQASWRPWLDHAPLVRKHAVQVAAQSRFLVAVSRSLATSIAGFIDLGDRLRVIPNVVDEQVFTLPDKHIEPVANRIIFVGLIRRVKGLDLLLEAMRLLLDQGREVTLAVVGESFYGAYRADHDAALEQVAALGLQSCVTFLGGLPPDQVAREIWKSRALVLPSRRETFAAVVAEAIACGRPVVATRCGGPEDIVTEDVGILVAPESPAALAAGIATVLDRRYDPASLREHAVSRFGMCTVGEQLVRLYDDALRSGAS